MELSSVHKKMHTFNCLKVITALDRRWTRNALVVSLVRYGFKSTIQIINDSSVELLNNTWYSKDTFSHENNKIAN